MKKLLFLFHLLLIVTYSSAQAVDESSDNSDFTEAQFPGGWDSMYEWLRENAKYPDNALPYGISTDILTSFDITEDGYAENIWLWFPGYNEFDYEAFRLLASMPRWIPAMQNGKPVKESRSLGISFSAGGNGSVNDWDIQLNIPVMSEECSVMESLYSVLEHTRRERHPYPGEDSKDTSGIKYVLEEATFEGGIPGLMSWLRDNVVYHEEAYKRGIQGTVTVKFNINKEGSIGEVEVMNVTHLELEQEALRVVRSMPKWKPAKFMGNPVSTPFVIPINFVKPN